MTEPTRRRVTDRQVVLLMAAVVVAVLVLNVLSAMVPGVDRILAVTPVLLVVLVVGTLYVLLGAVRRS
ncbi:MAG: hypothetical protein QOH61_1457 [Chloroflexota bacterium]|nr:hypothetical protein [Chloroflexota bacterium]